MTTIVRVVGFDLPTADDEGNYSIEVECNLIQGQWWDICGTVDVLTSEQKAAARTALAKMLVAAGHIGPPANAPVSRRKREAFLGTEQLPKD